MSDQPAERSDDAPYRVLARKYRPATFGDLIGQEALVRTLTNAIEGGRLAHAFILTGVRGVGKTTTARIIARALNCIGPDGNGGPTITPCGACEHCTAIAQDRHVDVIEMDAASRTGVGDIRELIEGVRYRPVQARYKVYIIDEVHMLSNNAFNALLKTLEEPPEHVIFIFATTEIRKVPVTVLSRCQRFDLRRVDQQVLAEHFTKVAGQESVEVETEAISMIARAADGSVRDGLSLLDQAIALGGGGKIEEAQVRHMLGLADRARVLDLFEAVMRAALPEALEIFSDLYAAGADPAVVLEDLLELTHTLTRAKLVPESLADQPENERRRGAEMAGKLSMAVLARTWQMLLKGLGEVQMATAPLQATEMVLIRLAYASDLPAPGDLVQKLQGAKDGSGESSPAPSSGPAGNGGGPRAQSVGDAQTVTVQPAQAQAAPQLIQDTAPAVEPVQQLHPAPAAENLPQPQSFVEVVQLLRQARQMNLAGHLIDDVHLVHFEQGRIEMRPGERAPASLAGLLGKFLQEATGQRWVVSLSRERGAETLRDQERTLEKSEREKLMDHPLVKAVMDTFPGSEFVERRGGPSVLGGKSVGVESQQEKALESPEHKNEGDDLA